MTRDQRWLLTLWGVAGLLALPWAIEALYVALRRRQWLPPAIPAFRLDTPRRTR